MTHKLALHQGLPQQAEVRAAAAEFCLQPPEGLFFYVRKDHLSNHAIGLFQLAAIHLNQRPPHLDEARLANDALAALVEGLAGRLGEEEAALRDALNQLRMAFVQLAQSGGAEPETPAAEA